MSLNQIIFWISTGIFFTGLYAVIAEIGKARRIGAAVTVLAAVGIAYSVQGLVREWSQAEMPTVNTAGGGTGGNKAGGGKGAPGGNGGTYIDKQINYFGTLKMVGLSRVCHEDMLPISIPPNTTSTPTYILRIHPKLMDNPNGWVPESMVNTSDKNESWPPQTLAKGPKCCDMSTYRCDFQNLGEIPFLSVSIEFLPTLQNETLVNPHHKTFIINDTLAVGQKFTVYLVNESNTTVTCWYPMFANVQLLGETTTRKISIASSNATFFDEIQFAVLFPTRFKWQGLP